MVIIVITPLESIDEIFTPAAELLLYSLAIKAGAIIPSSAANDIPSQAIRK